MSPSATLPVPASTEIAPRTIIKGFYESSVSNLTADEHKQWQQLYACTPAAGASAHPQIVQLREDAKLLRLVDESGVWQAAAALLPETLRVHRHVLPGTCGPRPGLHLAGNRILARDHETATDTMVTAIANRLVTAGDGLLELEDIPHHSPLWTALQRQKHRGFHVCTPLPPQPHRLLTLPATADEYWGTFSSKTRSQMRRRRRKLDARLRRFTRPDEVDEFLEVGHGLSLKTWQWHTNGLCLARDEASHIRRRSLAEMGLWRAYLLYSNDEPVAFVDSCQSAGVYDYQQPGYDRAFAKMGPGRVLITAIIDDLYEWNPAHTIDFGPGDMPYKEEFANRHTMNATVWVMPPGFTSWKIVRSLHGRQRVHRAARAVLTRLGLFQRLKTLSRCRSRSAVGDN